MIKITSADRYFSMCVRQRANWSCERCHVGYTPPTQALHCSHYFGRGNWSTRFDPLNAAALCFGCHQYLGAHPHEHNAFFAARIGVDELDRLRGIASKPAHGIKKHIRAIGQFYKREYDEMRLGGQFRAWLPDMKFEVVM